MLKTISKVAVIGGGIMGSGIAALCASAGIKTMLLRAHKPDKEEIGATDVNSFFAKKQNLFYDMKKDLNNLSMGYLDDKLIELKDCDLIIEAITEDLKLKQDLFSRIDEACGSDTIIASNTSGLPISLLIEKQSKRFKENFLVMHFYNPVKMMKLLELVAGANTKPEIMQFIGDWSEKFLGKGVVWAKDTPSFIGNRIGSMLIASCVHEIDKGEITAADIDFMLGKAMGFPSTGIFMLLDMLGLDTFSMLCANAHANLPKDERRDVYALPSFFKDMIDKQMYGDKTPATGGFYKRTPDKKRHMLNIKTMEYSEYDKNYVPEALKSAMGHSSIAGKQQDIVFGNSAQSKAAWRIISGCLCYALNRIPEIADSCVDIDRAMKWGYGWTYGPFELLDNLGLYAVIDKLKSEGTPLPENLGAMMACGAERVYQTKNGVLEYFDFTSKKYKPVPVNKSFVFLDGLKSNGKTVKECSSASLIDLGDDVFCLEFHTKMNALNNEAVDFTSEALQIVNEKAAGLVIGNQGAAFSAGGDLAYMGNLAANKKWSEIDSLIKNVHSTHMGIKYSPFPVVAAPFGQTLGGGAEICLAADRIVACMDVNMGLVEIGSGLLPSGGGCMNLWRRFTEFLPSSVILVDNNNLFTACLHVIAEARVSKSAKDAANNGFLRASDRIVMNRDHLIGEAKREVLHILESGYTPPAKTPLLALGDTVLAKTMVDTFNGRIAGNLSPHMETIVRKIAYVISGGEVAPGSYVSEDYMLKLEREAFVSLWQTEETQKMADHILKTGKVLPL